MVLWWFGLRQMARGLRRGNPAMAGFGMLLVLVGLLRRSSGGKLLYSTRLKPGQSLRVERPGMGEAIDVG